MKIVVTGPHRSCTTFIAKALAHDFGYEFVPEERFFYSDLKRFKAYLNSDKKIVLQAPWLAYCIHQFAHLIDECVWVVRDIEDVVASRCKMRDSVGNPVSWNMIEYNLKQLYRRQDDNRDIYHIQYEHWQQQKKRFNKSREVNYTDLEAHPLFIKTRTNFHLRQIEKGQEVERKYFLGEPVAFSRTR